MACEVNLPGLQSLIQACRDQLQSLCPDALQKKGLPELEAAALSVHIKLDVAAAATALRYGDL